MAMNIRSVLRSLAAGRYRGRPETLQARLAMLFDADWYLKGLDGRKPFGSPLNHYLHSDGHLLHDPNPMFDTSWYLSRHPELIGKKINPLVHYIEHGEPDGDAPSPRFDPKWYLEAYPDVAAAGMSPLGHYLQYGIKDGRLPKRPDLDLSVLFDAKWYLAGFEGQKPAGDPLEHYLQGGFLTHDPNPMFDTAWYLEQHPELLKSGVNPLVHYIEEGEREGHAPGPKFDPTWYLERYPDVAAADVSPLSHYLQHGVREGRLALRPRRFADAKELFACLAELAPALEAQTCSVELPLNSLTGPKRPSSARTIYTAPEISCIGVQPLSYPAAGAVFELEKPLVIAGTRYLISRGGEIIHDEDAHFHTMPGAAIKYPGARRAPAIGNMELRFGARQGAWLNRGIDVMHEYDSNYFHFIAETIPRIMLVEESGLPPDIPLLFTDDLHPNLKELLRRVNVKRRPVIELERGTAYRVDRLHYASDLSTVVDAYEGGEAARQTGLDVERIRKGIEICRSTVARTEGRRRKIFAARGGGSRLMLNQNEAEMRLAEIGFETVRVETLGLQEQMEIFQQADIVIGPTGAQMSNMVWCQPGTDIVVLASDHHSHQLYLWELLGQVAGVRVTIIQGPRAYNRTDFYSLHDDYSVDVDAIVNAAQIKDRAP